MKPSSSGYVLGGFFGVVIEPEEWRKFVHGWRGTSHEVASDKPTPFAGLRLEQVLGCDFPLLNSPDWRR